jgi:hypothetical protein
VSIPIAIIRVVPLFAAVAVGVSRLVGPTVVIVLEFAVLVFMFHAVLPAFLEKFVAIEGGIIAV